MSDTDTDGKIAQQSTAQSVFNLFNIHAELTDMGNCDRFTATCGEDYRYVTLWRKWIHWNGKCWEIDNSEAVVAHAMKFIRYCQLLAKNSDLPKKVAEALGDFLYKCESNARIQSMLTLAHV